MHFFVVFAASVAADTNRTNEDKKYISQGPPIQSDEQQGFRLKYPKVFFVIH